VIRAALVATLALALVPAASAARVTQARITLNTDTMSANVHFTQTGLVPYSDHVYVLHVIAHEMWVGAWHVHLVNPRSRRGINQYCAWNRSVETTGAGLTLGFPARANGNGVVHDVLSFGITSPKPLELARLAVIDPSLTMDGVRVGRAVLHAVRWYDPSVIAQGHPHDDPPCKG
jgi:hypothetical protein